MAPPPPDSVEFEQPHRVVGDQTDGDECGKVDRAPARRVTARHRRVRA
jgi:hypothetical protein